MKANGGWSDGLRKRIARCTEFATNLNNAASEVRKFGSRESAELASRLSAEAEVIVTIKSVLENDERAAVTGLVQAYRAQELGSKESFRRTYAELEKQLRAATEKVESAALAIRAIGSSKPSFEDLERRMTDQIMDRDGPQKGFKSSMTLTIGLLLLDPKSLEQLVRTQILLPLGEYDLDLLLMSVL